MAASYRTSCWSISDNCGVPSICHPSSEAPIHRQRIVGVVTMEAADGGGFRMRLRPSIANCVGVPEAAERHEVTPVETFDVFRFIAKVEVGFNRLPLYSTHTIHARLRGRTYSNWLATRGIASSSWMSTCNSEASQTSEGMMNASRSLSGTSFSVG